MNEIVIKVEMKKNCLFFYEVGGYCNGGLWVWFVVFVCKVYV